MVDKVARLARLSVATLLVVAACQRAPARIYTDAEIAKLEERVMAKVAEVDASCSHPELLEIDTVLDDACWKAFDVVDRQRRAHTPIVEQNVDTKEIADLDELCGAKTLEALGRAALTSPGCSPNQVGVRAQSISSPKNEMFARMRVSHVVLFHALREIDPYVALTELL
ncbi:MAG TPA: hypothetical protein VMZ53_10025, partial [Kofleriaceae bacterium]|nr:hypothetical protein [Kofleriaceae bacterium]